MQFDEVTFTVPPHIAAACWAHAILRAFPDNIVPGTSVTKLMENLSDDFIDPCDLIAADRLNATIDASAHAAEAPPKQATFHRRKVLARGAPTNRIEIKVLYPLAALIRMRTIAELLTHLAAAVWVKYRKDGRPPEGANVWDPKTSDQRYQFVLSQLHIIAPLIGTSQIRLAYWVPTITVVTLPTPLFVAAARTVDTLRL